jgi:hypothetical protein
LGRILCYGRDRPNEGFSMAKARAVKSAIQRWTLVLILLLAIGLTGCTPSSPPPPTETLGPTPKLSPPEAPMTDPAGEITVEAGKKIAVRASATGARRYEWTLRGEGEIAQSIGPAILYTAPKEGDAIAILTVTAYNDQGASPQASLTINVPPIATVSLDALAVPAGWMTGGDSPESFISLAASPNGCHTGSDCRRFTYRPGGKWGGVYWWPFCIGMIMDVRCQEDGEWRSAYKGPLCIASVKTQTWDEVQKGTCSINVLEAGNLSLHFAP